MISRINKFIFVFCVVALALYLVVLNRESMSVSLLPGSKFSGNAGVILIGTFALGIIVASLVGIFFGLKGYFRERRLIALENQRKSFYEGMLKARGYSASGEWNKARTQWESLIKKDSTDIIARCELSRCLQAAGEQIEALRILDAARAADPKNIEVLFRAAELNVDLGNKTAAIDNLALILYDHPSKRAATMARDLSEELGRIEDALEYQSRLESLERNSSEHEAIAARLEFKKLLKTSGEDTQLLRTELKIFCRKHPEFVPALHRLALLESQLGNLEDAAQYYVKAAKASRSSSYWNEISKLWIDKKDPERALAAARSATKETEGEARLIAELELIRIQISLSLFEEARRSLDSFKDLVKSQNFSLPIELMQQFFVLKGLYLSSTGAHAQAAEIWKKLSQQDFEMNAVAYVPGSSLNGDAPAPRLSTP